jgi:hypothetical protein
MPVDQIYQILGIKMDKYEIYELLLSNFPQKKAAFILNLDESKITYQKFEAYMSFWTGSTFSLNIGTISQNETVPLQSNNSSSCTSENNNQSLIKDDSDSDNNEFDRYGLYKVNTRIEDCLDTLLESDSKVPETDLIVQMLTHDVDEHEHCIIGILINDIILRKWYGRGKNPDVDAEGVNFNVIVEKHELVKQQLSKLKCDTSKINLYNVQSECVCDC